MVASLLVIYLQDPTSSLNPSYPLLIIGACASFIFSLGDFLERKHGWKRTVWDVIGVLLAGFVLLSWSRYYSFSATLIADSFLMISMVLATTMRRRQIAKWYGGRWKTIIFVALILVAIVPLGAVTISTNGRPIVVVSPTQSYLSLHERESSNVPVQVASVYSSAWNISVAVKSSGPLAVYLNGIRNGPIEIPFLDRGANKTVFLRVETSPRITGGSYNVTLSFTYADSLGGRYSGSTNVEVDVCRVSEVCPVPAGNIIPGVVGIVAVLAVGLVLVLLLLGRRRPKVPGVY